ncbi:MAG: hypothetical protein A2W21_04695 [Betaproteobacteria bacterium RBG_16_66_20]|nr:MAG: hypothetical protein A2W21_04695 [Betaproteobacteria bacterium RBG_16_66_20]
MEGFQITQSLVSRDDEIGACSKRASEHRIVIRVGCGACDRGGNDALGKCLIEGEHFGYRAMLASEASGDVLAIKHLGQFD